MIRTLLPFLGAAAILAAAPPAGAQYVYLDLNGDGVCTASDVSTSATTSVDIYFDTDHNADGSTVTCPQDAGSPMDMFSYEFILHASGPGIVTYGTYTDNMHNVVPGGFSVAFGETKGGADYHNGFGGTNEYVTSGRHKVGTLAIAVRGTPYLFIAASSPLNANFITAFGSECFGVGFNDTITLGSASDVGVTADFSDNCGTGFVSPVRATTWGAIKAAYL
jgi:hypothetical protein